MKKTYGCLDRDSIATEWIGQEEMVSKKSHLTEVTFCSEVKHVYELLAVLGILIFYSHFLFASSDVEKLS